MTDDTFPGYPPGGYDYGEPTTAADIADIIRKVRRRDLGQVYSVQTPVFDKAVNLDEVYADLVGITELVEALGVKRAKIYKWIELRESTGCPHPVRILVCGYLFSKASWMGWFAVWKQTRGKGFYDDDE